MSRREGRWSKENDGSKKKKMVPRVVWLRKDDGWKWMDGVPATEPGGSRLWLK